MFSEAETLLQETLSLRRRVNGDADFSTIDCVHILTHLLVAQHKVAEARELYDHFFPIVRRILGPQHPLTVAMMAAPSYFLGPKT